MSTFAHEREKIHRFYDFFKLIISAIKKCIKNVHRDISDNLDERKLAISHRMLN